MHFVKNQCMMVDSIYLKLQRLQRVGLATPDCNLVNVQEYRVNLPQTGEV